MGIKFVVDVSLIIGIMFLGSGGAVTLTSIEDIIKSKEAIKRSRVQERRLRQLQQRAFRYNRHPMNDFISGRYEIESSPQIEREERKLRDIVGKSRQRKLKHAKTKTAHKSKRVRHHKKAKATKRHNHRKLAVNHFAKYERIHENFEKNFGKLEDDMSRMLMGGGGGSVVVAPNQGAGIANAQVVVNSLGTPASMPYSGGKVIPGYNAGDADPKVIVTRMQLPGIRQLKKGSNKKSVL